MWKQTHLLGNGSGEGLNSLLCDAVGSILCLPRCVVHSRLQYL